MSTGSLQNFQNNIFEVALGLESKLLYSNGLFVRNLIPIGISEILRSDFVLVVIKIILFCKNKLSIIVLTLF